MGNTGYPMTTDALKKKTSRLATATLAIGICTWCAGIGYLGAYQKYWDSLRTNNIAGNLMGIFGTSWFLLSAITLFAFIISIAWVAWTRDKHKGFKEAFSALIVVLVIASLVMPTLGLTNSTQYKRQAGTVAWEYLKEYKTSQADKGNVQSMSLANYNVEIIKDYDISLYEMRKVEVVYTLKEEFEMFSCPQQFSVLLDFETGEKSIKEDNSTEE